MYSINFKSVSHAHLISMSLKIIPNLFSNKTLYLMLARCFPRMCNRFNVWAIRGMVGNTCRNTNNLRALQQNIPNSKKLFGKVDVSCKSLESIYMSSENYFFLIFL